MERRPFGYLTLQQRQLVRALLPLPVLRGRMSLTVSSGMLTVDVPGTPGRLALPLTTSLEWEPVPELAVAQLLLLRVLVLATKLLVNLKTTLTAGHALGVLLGTVHRLMSLPAVATPVNALKTIPPVFGRTQTVRVERLATLETIPTKEPAKP